jgi:aryl-alcohol dehydrogenase-like predicted oxidoreductase
MAGMSGDTAGLAGGLALGGGPRVGLGLAALGRPGYIDLGHGLDFAGDSDVAGMEARAHEVLDAAWSVGVRYFDAARSYGRAEQFLGSWLGRRRLAPAVVAVGSKWGYTYTADWHVDAEVHEVKELTLATFERQRAETLDLLGRYLRLYQIHSATLDSGVLDDRELLATLADWRRSTGVALGISVSGAGQSETIERALALGLFDSVQATWNLLEPSAGPALAAAHDAGLKVLVKEAVANGRLTQRGTGAAVKLLAAEAARQGEGIGVDAVALAAVLAQPWADMVLSGATTAAMVRSNLTALELELDAGTLERLGGLALGPQQYWQQRAELPWN